MPNMTLVPALEQYFSNFFTPCTASEKSFLLPVLLLTLASAANTSVASTSVSPGTLEMFSCSALLSPLVLVSRYVCGGVES